MVRYAAGLLLVALVGGTPAPAFALGRDFPKDELERRGTFVKGQTPVHGFFVNWTDVFFYAGDARAFNEFVAACDKVKKDKLKVVVHQGPKFASSPWDAAPRNIATDWSL